MRFAFNQGGIFRRFRRSVSQQTLTNLPDTVKAEKTNAYEGRCIRLGGGVGG